MPQPGGTRLRPRGAWVVTRADAEVMGGSRIDVQLRRDAGFLQRKVHQHTVLRRTDDISPAVADSDSPEAEITAVWRN